MLRYEEKYSYDSLYITVYTEYFYLAVCTYLVHINLRDSVGSI